MKHAPMLICLITPFVEAIFDRDSFPVLHHREARFYRQTSLIWEKPSDMEKSRRIWRIRRQLQLRQNKLSSNQNATSKLEFEIDQVLNEYF